MKISAVIVTYNNEKKIEACLQSLQGVADEIIVVDSESTDYTRKIAGYFTSKVFKYSPTDYAELKNIGHRLASYFWILSVEPDERLSTELRVELLRLKKKQVEAEGFSIPRISFYLGRWIRHSGWYPNRRVRLYNKDNGFWIKETFRVFLKFSGKIKKLRYPVEHLAFSSLSDHVIYLNRLSERRAQQLYSRRKKARLYHFCFLPMLRFFRTYFLKAGWLDGYPGLVISTMSAYSVFLRYAKLKEIWKKGEKIEPVPCSQ